jgi:hypothetical protein
MKPSENKLGSDSESLRGGNASSPASLGLSMKKPVHALEVLLWTTCSQRVLQIGWCISVTIRKVYPHSLLPIPVEHRSDRVVFRGG